MLCLLVDPNIWFFALKILTCLVTDDVFHFVFPTNVEPKLPYCECDLLKKCDLKYIFKVVEYLAYLKTICTV